MTPFVSLNSWAAPGWIYQAEEPDEILAGGPGEWDRLEAALDRRRVRVRADASPHPRGAAVGWVEYEGSWWFAFFPELRAVPTGTPTVAWTRRRSAWQHAAAECGPWRGGMTRVQYEAAVRAAQERIARGDIYQVNLTHRLAARATGNPYALFEHLCARSPAPGAAFLDAGFGAGGRAVLSASPELFLQVQGREISTRPIKGTRPRSRDPQEDTRLACELQTDPKEIAELVMITDLERNDLGRVCEYGSVHAPDLLRLEKFAQVQHLVSTVTGRLRPEVSAVRALAACFPGGSITGAPKKTAMEAIAALEPEPRGLYTGALGWLGFDGDAAFSIAIRTLVWEGDGTLHYHVGAGITADSVPAREWEETLHKGAGLRLAVERWLAEGKAATGVPRRID